MNKSRIYDEDSKARSAHYKSVNERKGKRQYRGEPYVTPVDRGNIRVLKAKGQVGEIRTFLRHATIVVSQDIASLSVRRI